MDPLRMHRRGPTPTLRLESQEARRVLVGPQAARAGVLQQSKESVHGLERSVLHLEWTSESGSARQRYMTALKRHSPRQHGSPVGLHWE